MKLPEWLEKQALVEAKDGKWVDLGEQVLHRGHGAG